MAVPQTSRSPGPPAQDTDSWRRDIKFYLHYSKDTGWLYGAGCVAQGGFGKPPDTPQDVALGVLGTAPTESLHSLCWEGPSAGHPVPAPSKGRDTFHKTSQLLHIVTKALRACKASRQCVPEAGGCGRCQQGQIPAALQTHQVCALALHKCTLM